MTGVDILLNHARVRTRFACACVYELIEYMSLNKQFLILYIMVKLLMLVFMFFFMKFIFKCILYILEYIKYWMDRY